MRNHTGRRAPKWRRTGGLILLVPCIGLVVGGCALPGVPMRSTGPSVPLAPSSAPLSPEPEPSFALPTKWPFATEPGLSPEAPPLLPP